MDFEVDLEVDELNLLIAVHNARRLVARLPDKQKSKVWDPFVARIHAARVAGWPVSEIVAQIVDWFTVEIDRIEQAKALASLNA